MLPLVDKPIIQYGVEEAMASGCDQILIITGRGKQAIEDHFDVSYELEKMLEERGKTDLLKIVRSISDMIDVSYVRQKEALGLGHAVLRAKELVGHEPFAVVLSDDIITSETPCIRQLLDIYEYYGASVLALMEVPANQISAYGVVDAELVSDNGRENRLFRIRNMVEKPKASEAPSNLAIIGRYILTPEIFSCIESIPPGSGGEIQLTDAIRSLVKKGAKILGVKLAPNEQRFDIGNHHFPSLARTALAEALVATAPDGLTKVMYGSGGGEGQSGRRRGPVSHHDSWPERTTGRRGVLRRARAAAR